jgi:stalled ribosome rescue protein Dom34
MHTHAVIWIDHKEARIFHVHSDTIDDTTVLAPHAIHRPPKGRGVGREHPDDAKRFFREVAQSLDGTDTILILGPSTTKLAFFRYVREHDRTLERKVVCIETVDRPTDGEMVAHLKRYFKARDQLGRPMPILTPHGSVAL